MYKGTQLSGVLFVLIVKKFPSVNFFYTSAAIDAMDKYQVCITVLRKRGKSSYKATFFYNRILLEVLGSPAYDETIAHLAGEFL